MGERLQKWFWKSQAEILHKCFWKIFSVCESPAEPHGMRFRGLVNKINAWARKYILRFFLVFAWVCASLFPANGNDSRMRKTSNRKHHANHHTHSLPSRGSIDNRFCANLRGHGRRSDRAFNRLSQIIKMRSYDETLNAVVRYIEKHGKNQNTLDKLEDMLPGVWALNLIADALDILENR